MDKKSNNVLTIGGQYGRVGRKITDLLKFRGGDLILEELQNVPAASTKDNLLGGGGTTGSPGSQDPETTYTDINAGLLFRSIVNNNTNFNIGFSTRHITSPERDFNFRTGENIDLA